MYDAPRCKVTGTLADGFHAGAVALGACGILETSSRTRENTPILTGRRSCIASHPVRSAKNERELAVQCAPPPTSPCSRNASAPSDMTAINELLDCLALSPL